MKIRLKPLLAFAALILCPSALALADASPSPNASDAERIEKWCKETRDAIRRYKWTIEPCNGIDWKIGGSSVEGRPLVYAEFGDPNSSNKTLVFSTVHADEVTPLFTGIQLVNWMKDHHRQFSSLHIVVAPLVNPDGLARKPPTRVNARGVDVNRNFRTRDWETHALKSWKTKLKSNPRRFPGNAPRSEPETLFQEDLIKQIKPNKILSIHSPLNHLDYDGPNLLTLARFPKEYVTECLKLRKKVGAIHGGFFPGSLGNYAGIEMGIPTITLELPTADARKAEEYWKKFSTGIQTMIEFTVPNYAFQGETHLKRDGG